MKKLLILLATTLTFSAFSQTRDQVLQTIRTAVTAFDQKVGTNGAYVWFYLPDFSRSWGEAEAFRNMGWVERPGGVPAMGNIFLDLYIATNDRFYYDLARKSAKALIAGQLDNGGWNHFFSLDGDTAMERWYNTIGRQAWRMEEFMTFYQSATFDDYVHGDALFFLLRMYLQTQDSTYLLPLQRAIDLILRSQKRSGGWPERYPLELESYTSNLTLNDDVTLTNILSLIYVYQTHVARTPEIRQAIFAGMNVIVALQSGDPAPGWARQFCRITMKPTEGRTYEPAAINTSFTVEQIDALMDFYRLTGETKFLARIPEAIDWLESLAMTPEEIAFVGRTVSRTSITVPRNIDHITGEAIWTHRRGSNVATGYYFFNTDDPTNTIGHMSSFANININRLRRDYAATRALSREEILATSPLFTEEKVPLPRLHSPISLRWATHDRTAAEIIETLNADGFWITPLPFTSHPYQTIPQALWDAPKRSDDTRFATTQVGDEFDTSPFPPTEPIYGISVPIFITNIARLIQFLETLP